ncbi:VanW family protein [Clostridium sp.]
MSEYNRNSSGGRNFEHRGLEGGTLSSYNRAGHSSTGHRSSSGTSSHTKSTAAHTSTGRRDTAMNRAAAGRSGHTSGRYKKKRRNRLDITQILLIVIGVLAVILIAAIASRGCGGGSAAGGATESDAVQESTVADGEVTVNGVNIYGMTQEEARKAILDSFDWKMKVKYEDKETDVTNLMADKVDQLLEEIYASDLKPGETYEVNTENMIEDAKAEAALIAGNWNMAAKSGGISGYNKETGKFEFSEGTKGLVIDQDKLAQAMVDAIDKKEFDAVLTAETKEVAADSSVQDKYKTMSTYTTTTTSNSNRNENIRLAVAALNGTIVKPGQEFSFNNTTGARTEEKGYKPATAYLNGEVVQEPGGGVCQVSSTLYNAVVFAGLKSTERHAHSYEPSYVTPGEDAAVSYGGPDFKFVNNSEYPLAIKASFSASDRKLTIALYGVPILKEGVKIRMSSEKTGEIDAPSAVYTEDGTLQPGQEVQTKAATPGSRWSTDLVTYENDKEVSREFFHNSSYRGKAAQIKRNSSATVATNAAETTAAAESSAAETNAANESTAAHETTTAAPSSPGGETKAPATTTAASNEGPQETTPEPEETNPVVEANGPGSN